MRSPVTRLILGALALLSFGGAAYFVNEFEQQAAAARAAERAFDLSAREAASALADLRVSQLAYVAAGQDAAAWIPKVKDTADEAAKAITELQADARSESARTDLAKAREVMAEFAHVDQRARDYVKSGQALMASDVIFTEGDHGATDAAQQVNLARSAERQEREIVEAGLRVKQAQVLGGAAVAVTVILFLSLLSGRQKEMAAEPLSIAHAASPATSAPPAEVEEHREAPRPQTATIRPAGPVLRAASQLCTDLGRVTDLQELKGLIGQAADLMDASGVVVWVSSADGSYVQPALVHGYTPQIVARMSRIQRSADNAAAAAYRTSQMQIVLARPGESNGAVVAPLLAADGCIGALSAEIRSGGETSESVRALAALLAAQLAGVLNIAPAAQERPATATGTL
jgi:hypothetical protein